MKLLLRNRRGVRVLGVLLGLFPLVFSVGILFFGLEVPPVLVVLSMLFLLAFAAATLRRALVERHERLVWLLLATVGLWLIATTAFLKLLHMEADLVSEGADLVNDGRSVAVVDAVMWPVFVLGVTAFVAMLLIGFRLLTRPHRPTHLPRT
jgi:hypothetical protein